MRRHPAELVALRLQDAAAELFHCQARLVCHHVQHRLPQACVALAHHLVHLRHGHARVLQQTEGLAGLDRAQLLAVADQRQPCYVGLLCDPSQRPHLHSADHRGLVEDQHGAAQGFARLLHFLWQGDAVPHIAIAREESLQGAGRDVGFAREHKDCARRRGEADDLPLPRQISHRAQHGGLAGARVALHPHRAVGREQDRTGRIALTLVQSGLLQSGLDCSLRRQALSVVQARAHAGEDVAFGIERPVGDEGQVCPPRRHLDQVPVAPELGDTGIQHFERMPAAPVRQRPGAQVVGGEHGAPFLKMLDGAPHHRQRRRRRSRLALGKCRCADPVSAPCDVPVPCRAELPRPLLPRLMQDLPLRLRLAPTCVERRLLRPGGCVLPAPVGHVVEELPATGRKRVQHRPLVARDLEPRHPPYQRRHRGVADLLEPGPKLVPVVGPNEKLRAFHRGELGAAPRLVPAARHVGDHRVRVQLRVEVAARQVAEGRRDHAVGPHPRPATRLRVVAPGLEQLRLDEAQGGVHRLVVRLHHPRARLGPRVDQRLQRDRLGCREGHVHAGPVLVLTVAKPPQAKFGAGHVACEDSLEASWIDPPVQAEQIRRLAVPAAGLAVLRVVPGVIPVDLEVVHRPCGGLQACNGRDHGRLRLRCGVSILLERHRGQSERSSATRLGGVDAELKAA